ncbi:Cell division protein FtsK [hydrothermal vent metagenome]|uniref:Cell division protein FtsK n=1 Tax=hydrothermal vent metagenome TaxID=652676 RepID=A0A1W1EJN3_9ZZZZ
MKIIIIIVSILFTYTTISTIFHKTKLIGNIGQSIGDGNIFLFGYLAYIILFVLVYPFFKLIYTKSSMNKLEYSLGWILLIISILIAQFLLVGSYHSGFIAREFSTFLLPYIGKFGLFLFFIMTLMLSYVMILGDDMNETHDRWIDNLLNIMESIRFEFKNPFASNNDILEVKKSQKRVFNAKIIENEKKEALIDRDINDIAKIKTVEVAKKREIKEKKEDKLRAKKRIKEIEKKEKPVKEVISKKEKKIKSSSVEIEELLENKKLLDEIEKGESIKPDNFQLPSLDFLEKPKKSTQRMSEAQIDKKIEELLAKLKEFKIDGDVMHHYTGPLVTTFEFKPAANVKVSKILNLQDDLAMALSAETIRIQAPIPGRDVIGIEIPNSVFETIYLREILDSDIFKNSKSPLTLALGKDIVGHAFITDLKKLPHILIAGTTGSGKSVGINAMILSLLFKNSPDDLKIILIDPKMLEFSIYNDIPHLLTPVIIEAKKAIAVLANMVIEMERRYKLMASSRTKNIENHNAKAKKENLELFPYIVIVIDELADLMMTGGKEVEFSIARLAQMARASGIHLIIATQRPSVDVVTGLIKANLPTRLSYKVGQRIDSKVILDTQGAESLLGRGDGLFTPPATSNIVRIHAPWNSEEEIEKVVEFLKAQAEPNYDSRFLDSAEDGGGISKGNSVDELDKLYEDAKKIVLEDKKSSISYLQRKLQIGYNRSARIVEQLESMGVLSPANAKGNREILI